MNQADLTVIGGAGHVGIPLVLAFAEAGLTVNVNDRNKSALAMLQAGELPFIEHDGIVPLENAIKTNRLIFTSAPDGISRNGPIIVTIGTPVDEFLNPVRGAMRNLFEDLLPRIDESQLIILRSTVYPGTTDWLDQYIKRLGRRNKVAFCPERVVQGHGIREIRQMPQIVSATSIEAQQEAVDLFRLIAPEVVIASPIEAELAKLFSNAYRYIEFAATNQFYMVARRIGANYQAIVRTMTHNYPRLKGFPGPGFSAGPCLFKDTMQLTAFFGNEFGLGQAAMQINEGLVLHIAEDLRRKFDLSNMTIGLMGMAFKAEIDDTRGSLSYKLKKALQMLAYEVLCTDPYVKTDPAIVPLGEVINRSDILVLCTPHAVYKNADLKGKPVVDVWGFLADEASVI